ncbi:arsenate reductase ArsC [Lentisphaerota bacterium]|nr:arsenate reductase ArsC [Lentisphaerota bacterium]
MAEGWTRYLKGDIINAFSAGIETHGLNPDAVKVMAEAGVDISKQKSKNLNDFKDTEFDYVITVCDHANETCPWFPAGCKVIHAGFPDPPRLAEKLAENGASEAQQLDCRQVRDQIKAYIETLPGALHK